MKSYQFAINQSISEVNDTLYYMRTPNVVIFGKKKPLITGNDARLGLAVYVTYGLAKSAREELEGLSGVIESFGDDKKAKKKYIKNLEKKILKKYSPVIKRMSVYQGRVLLKLIDMEMGNSSYYYVKEFRGGFSAFFWQGVASFFGTNLKSKLEKNHDDEMIVYYTKLYDQGILYQFLAKRTTAFKSKKSRRK
ncbi:MAG: DUF4294 domain-containing protein [Bacteroidetes bacterium]|nr:DUF4294 domain-containing protein [Bacteroidota bacterium]